MFTACNIAWWILVLKVKCRKLNDWNCSCVGSKKLRRVSKSESQSKIIFHFYYYSLWKFNLIAKWRILRWQYDGEKERKGGGKIWEWMGLQNKLKDVKTDSVPRYNRNHRGCRVGNFNEEVFSTKKPSPKTTTIKEEWHEIIKPRMW